MNPRTSLRWPEVILIILGFLLVGLWLTYDTRARTLRSAENRMLDAVPHAAAFSDAPAVWLAEAPWCPTRLDSGVFGRIEIRRLGISALIAEGADPAQLERVVSHVPTSVFPGQPGHCALIGLREGGLRDLLDVREDDVIRIDTLQGTYNYVVDWRGVGGPRRVHVAGATETPSLTLATSSPFDGTGSAPVSFVVRARLVEPTGWRAP